MPRVSAAHEQEVRDRILRRRRSGLRREGLPRRDHRRRRPRERAVGRRHLHLLLGQGRAHPPDLRPDRGARARRAGGRLAPATTTAERLAIAIRLYVETIDEYDGAPGQVTLVQAWAEADREPGVREMLAAPPRAAGRCRPDAAAPGRSSRGELPAWLDVDAVTRGLLALLDGLMLQRIEAGDALSAGRSRSGGPTPMLAALLARERRPGVHEPVPEAVATRVASAPWRTSRRSSARSIPRPSGSRCPHEHTQIALWHIASRWDYWQLTRDEPVILEELARFRGRRRQRAGRPDAAGRGARPGLAARLATASGLHVVMGCGWYRDGLLPAGGAASTGGPSTTSPTSSSAEIDRRGGRRPASGPGSSARSAPTSRGSRRPRSASIGRRPGRPAGPGWPSRPTRCCRRSGSPSCGSSRRRALDPARVVIGHADSYPVLDHYLAIIERGANLEFDFLGMNFLALRAASARPRIDRAALRAARTRPRRPDPAQPGRLPRLAAQALRGQRLRLPRGDVPAAPARRRRHRRRDRDDDGGEPAPPADDRRLTRRRASRPRSARHCP